MLTIFTTPKPFVGHIAVIQRNALKSWTLLHPSVEIILFGDEEGAPEVAREFGLRHEPQVERNEAGLKRIDWLFDRAQELARNEILCYVNCDIVLAADFWRAVSRVVLKRRKFLMVGRRWDTEIDQAIDFTSPNWAHEVQRAALTTNRPRDEWWIDYFAFNRGLYYKNVPAFGIGRTGWDNWLLWYAGQAGGCVVDASHVVRAVHQNHDYTYHPQGQKGVFEDEEALRNRELAGGASHLHSIANATHILDEHGMQRNYSRDRRLFRGALLRIGEFLTYRVWLPIWHGILAITRPLRSVLGLRSKHL